MSSSAKELPVRDRCKINFSRHLRQNLTKAEKVLWRHLRAHRCAGVKFRRQHVIGDFILDFYSPTLRLAIEVDGGGHTELSQARYDQQRTSALNDQGIEVLRFWNHDVLSKEHLVMEEIHRKLLQRLKP